MTLHSPPVRMMRPLLRTTSSPCFTLLSARTLSTSTRMPVKAVCQPPPPRPHFRGAHREHGQLLRERDSLAFASTPYRVACPRACRRGRSAGSLRTRKRLLPHETLRLAVELLNELARQTFGLHDLLPLTHAELHQR